MDYKISFLEITSFFTPSTYIQNQSEYPIPSILRPVHTKISQCMQKLFLSGLIDSQKNFTFKYLYTHSTYYYTITMEYSIGSCVVTVRNGIEWDVEKSYNNESHQAHIWDWFMSWIKCGGNVIIVLVCPSKYS